MGLIVPLALLSSLSLATPYLPPQPLQHTYTPFQTGPETLLKSRAYRSSESGYGMHKFLSKKLGRVERSDILGGILEQLRAGDETGRELYGDGVSLGNRRRHYISKKLSNDVGIQDRSKTGDMIEDPVYYMLLSSNLDKPVVPS